MNPYKKMYALSEEQYKHYKNLVGDDSLPAPNSSSPAPNGSLPAPNSSLHAPNGSLPAPNGSLPAPNGSLPAPNGSMHKDHHKCETCDRKFQHKRNLNRHRRIHTAAKLYPNWLTL